MFLASSQGNADQSVRLDFESLNDGTPFSGASDSFTDNEYAAANLFINDSDTTSGITFVNLTNPDNVNTAISGYYINVGAFGGNTLLDLDFTSPVKSLGFDFATPSGSLNVFLFDYSGEPINIDPLVFTGNGTFVNPSGFDTISGAVQIDDFGLIGSVRIQSLPSEGLTVDNLEFEVVSPNGVGIDFDTLANGTPFSRPSSSFMQDEYLSLNLSVVDSDPFLGSTPVNFTNINNGDTAISGYYINVGGFIGIDTFIELDFADPVSEFSFDYASPTGNVTVFLFAEDETSLGNIQLAGSGSFILPSGSTIESGQAIFAGSDRIGRIVVQSPTTSILIMDNLSFLAIVLGDVNCDGVANLLDVGPFVDLLSSGAASVNADINGDGVVDLLDVGGFVDILSGS